MRKYGIALSLLFFSTLSFAGLFTTNGVGAGKLVISRNGAGKLTRSSLLEPPALLTLTGTPVSVTGTWQPPTEFAVNTYLLQISTAQDFTGTVFSTQTVTSSATITGLSATTLYYGRVSATGSTFYSIFSYNAKTTTPASISLVQSTCSASSSHNGIYFLTFASSVTAGNTIIVGIADTGDALGTGIAVSVPAATYTEYPANGIGNGSAGVAIYASTNIPTGGTGYKVTVTQGGGTAGMSMCMAEVSGVNTFDISKTASATGTNATTGSYTTTSTDFCYAIMSHSSATTALTPNGTQIAEDENNSSDQAYNAQYTIPSSGPNSSSWVNSSVSYVVNSACFK